MEFKEFCKERKRMCSQAGCSHCDIYRMMGVDTSCIEYCITNSDEVEKIVSEWAKENPFITNADKFKEVFGFGFIITSYGIKTDRTVKSMRKWLQQEYQPPIEEETDGQS